MILYFIALFLVPIYVLLASLLASWVNRKLKARLQWRVGPPFMQPLIDVVKLFGKESVAPSTASPLIYDIAPAIAFASALTLALIVPLGLEEPILRGGGDLIMILYVLSLIPGMMILGGYSSGSPYSMLGCRRQVIIMVSVEIPLIISVLTLGVIAGGFNISKIIAYQEVNGILALKYPLLLLTLLLVYPAEVMMNPLTLTNAETEIVEGPFTEYSGRRLALLELAHLTERFILASLIVDLFFHLDFGIPLANIIYNVTCSLFIIVFYTFIEAVSSRIRIIEAVKWYIVFTNIICIIGLIQAVVERTFLRVV